MLTAPTPRAIFSPSVATRAGAGGAAGRLTPRWRLVRRAEAVAMGRTPCGHRGLRAVFRPSLGDLRESAVGTLKIGSGELHRAATAGSGVVRTGGARSEQNGACAPRPVLRTGPRPA